MTPGIASGHARSLLRRPALSPHTRVVLALVIIAASLGSCAWMPSEFNLSPIYRHRLDRDGTVLEMDVLWPIIHYETTADGGTDFRIRPLYRRVEKPDTDGFGGSQDTTETKPPKKNPGTPQTNQVDHQFLWPLGRVRVRENETHSRLFPIWNYDSRQSLDGASESDWYFLFPFFWGGTDQKAPDLPVERYFGMFPLWLDAPGEFLTYDRLSFHLWPLHTRTEKDGRIGHIFLWPLIGYGYADREDQSYWHRFLPFYNYIARQDKYERHSVLWPFITWGTDLQDTGDPLFGFQFWPLFGWQTSETRSTWSFLWPFFRGNKIAGKKDELHLFWPFYHSLYDDTTGRDIHSWWLWPFVSRTKATHQDSWSFLWPMIWWREYDDPDGKQTQQWIAPFFKHVHRTWKSSPSSWHAGGEDDYLQIWPLFHNETKRDGRAEFAFPSPWFFRDGNEEGVGEAYDWIYTLFRTKSRAPGDDSAKVIANLFTTRTRDERTQTSVPFLFSYESEGDAGTFYLFNCIPFRFGEKGGSQ
jgi:hypothetical protein